MGSALRYRPARAYLVYYFAARVEAWYENTRCSHVPAETDLWLLRKCYTAVSIFA